MDLNKAAKIIMFAVGLTIVIGLLTLMFKQATSDGRVEYCYIISDSYRFPKTYKLYGFRPWRGDRDMGTYLTFEEALKNAQSINCKIEAN